MLKITLLLILISAVPYCNKCIDNGDSCADSFSFNILNKTNGQNLIFGTNAVYNSDSVYLTTTRPGYLGKMSYVEIDRFKSSLLIAVDTFFLKLSATDTDTLLMQYDFVKDQCCVNGQYGRVSAIIYNGFAAEKVDNVFIFRK
jgi:hypothetical protein